MVNRYQPGAQARGLERPLAADDGDGRLRSEIAKSVEQPDAQPASRSSGRTHDRA